MAARWKFGDDPLLKHWKYRLKHEKFCGRPRQINRRMVLAYATDIERALKSLTPSQWDELIAPRSLEHVAVLIESLRCADNPHQQEEDFAACARCTLLGGWPNHRNNVWPTLVPPEGELSAGLALVRVENRTVPELIFEVLDTTKHFPQSRAKQARFIADSIAAPALYDQIRTPLEWANVPVKCGVEKSERPVHVPLPKAVVWKVSLRYSRDLCAKERARRRGRNNAL